MGNSKLTLLQETPGSELNATYEVLGHLGITREHLKKIRTDPGHAAIVCDAIKGRDLSWATSDWLGQLVLRQLKYHLNFFGRDFDLTPFITTIKDYGKKLVTYWKGLGFEPIFLPEVLMSRDADYPGWKIKLKEWLYEQSDAKQLLRLRDNKLVVANAYQLENITALVDTRCKPAYDNGCQVYQVDCLEPIIERLRQQRTLTDYTAGPRGSRFGISADGECEQVLKPAVAELLKLAPEKLRLETIIEANVIPQMCLDLPRKEDGITNTSVWYEEYYQSRERRLGGGVSDVSGLAYVRCDVAGDRWDYRSVRFLAVL